MNYTLHQLRVFLQIVKTKSITKAAEALHLTQPAVSIQIRNLQDQFPIPLLEMVHKKIYITEFGLEIAQAAEKILEEVEAIHNKVHAHRGNLSGKLRLSVVSTGKYIAPYFVTDFMKNQPGVDLVMDVTNKTQVIRSLEKNEVDFALVSVLPANIRIESIELMQNKLFLVGKHEGQTVKTEYDRKWLQKFPLIYREQGSGTRQVMEQFLRKNHITAVKKMELTSNEAVKQAVIAGLGYSIMPLIGIKNELMNGQLRIIPIKGFPIRSMWHLIRLRGKKLSPVAAAYLEHILQEKENIIRDKFEWFEAY